MNRFRQHAERFARVTILVALVSLAALALACDGGTVLEPTHDRLRPSLGQIDPCDYNAVGSFDGYEAHQICETLLEIGQFCSNVQDSLWDWFFNSGYMQSANSEDLGSSTGAWAPNGNLHDVIWLNVDHEEFWSNTAVVILHEYAHSLGYGNEPGQDPLAEYWAIALLQYGGNCY